MMASLALDVFGPLGIAAKPLTLPVAAGTAAVLAGAVALVLGQERGAPNPSAAKIGWILLALVAGAALPLQGAVNGLLRHDLGAPFAVGVISFIVATLTMLVALLLAAGVLHAPKPRVSGVSAMPWWGRLGGLAGASYVVTVFTAIPVVGAATAVGLTIAGQQVASALVDHQGWFRLPVRRISGLRLAGIGLLLVGVGLIKIV